MVGQETGIFAVRKSSAGEQILACPFHRKVAQALEATKPFLVAHNLKMQN